MTIDDKIMDEKLRYDINKEAAKISALSSGKIDKYECLTSDAILPSDKSRIIGQAKFKYYPLGKPIKNQIKANEEQGKKQIKTIEQHGNLLVKNNEKESSIHQKQKKNSEDLTNKRMEEIQVLSKQIDFSNLTYHYKDTNDPKKFIGFKGPINFYRSIKECYITVEKAEEQQQKLNGN